MSSRVAPLLAAALALLCLIGSDRFAAAQTTPVDSAATRSFERGENYALIVGVNRYDRAPPLNHAVADATRLAGELEALGYTVRLMTNHEAEPDDIVARIRAIAELMNSARGSARGNLVFAFSGHGFSQGEENFLATSRTDPDDLRGTALSMERLKRELGDTGIARQVLFIDACRNDPSKGPADPDQRFVVDDDAAGLAILYSTGPGQLSWEDPTLGHGVFSHYLSEGLAGNAADATGTVTFERLYRYVQRAVKTHVFTAYDRKQVPYIAGERTGRFVLGQIDPDARPASAYESGRSPADRVTGEVSTDSASPRRGWARIGIALGVIALGVLVAGSAGSSDSDDEESSVTLVVPTP